MRIASPEESSRSRVGRVLVSLVLAGALGLGSTACTSLIGVSDLPPATDSGADAPASAETGTHDAGGRDSGDAHDGRASSDARALSDATDGGTADGSTIDADAAPLPTLELSPSSVLAFGDAGGKLGFVACGNTGAPTRDLMLTNHGTGPLSFWTSFGAGAASVFKLSSACTSGAPCSIQPSAANAQTILVTGPVAPSDAGIVSYSDTLTIYWLNASTSGSTSIALKTTAYGAVIAFSQTDINFGAQPENQPDGGYPQTAQLENNGNGPFTGSLALHGALVNADGGEIDATSSSASELVLAKVGDAAVGDATLVQVPPASGTPFTVDFNPERTATATAGSVWVERAAGSSAESVLCAPLPGPITVEGQGTVSPVSVSSSLNFNTGPNGNNGIGISCGQSASAQILNVSNSGNAAAITSLTLVGGAESPFSVFPTASPTTPVALPAGTAAVPSMTPITITPSAIPTTAMPGGSFSDTLIVKTNAVGDLPHAVTLQMTAAGVVLVSTLSSATGATFSYVSEGEQLYYYVAFTNLGNVSTGQITGEPSGPDFTMPALNIGPYQTSETYIHYSAPIPGARSLAVELALPSTVPFCNPPSAPFNGTLSFPLHGSATLGEAQHPYDAVNANQIYLDGTCALAGMQGMPSTATISLKTSDPAGVSWTATLSGPGAAQFQLSQTSGTLPTNADFQITLTALGLQSTSGLTLAEVAGGIGAEVDINFTGSDGTETTAVSVYEKAQGAYLSWSAAALNVSAYAPTPFSLRNWGQFGSVSPSIASSNAMFSLNRTSGNTRFGSPLSLTVADQGATVGATTNVSVALPAGAGGDLCSPLPAPLPVTLIAVP